MKNFLSTFLILFFSLAGNAQVSITGIVSDKNETIIGANVFLKDTYDGASTDLDGKFSFTTEEKGTQVITITYIGYENFEQSIEIGSYDVEITIQLKAIANELNEVVITAGAFEASDEKKAVVLNSIDIVTTAGALADISSALNTLPGTQTVGEEGRLFVRGGAASETRTFIDGMFVQKPYSSSIPDVPARGRFSPFLFKGTIFSTGGYSAEYGQALSSALILNSQDLPDETTTSVSLMTVGANLGHTQRWDKTSLSVSGGYTNLAPYTSLVKQDLDWIKPFQGADGQIVFRHKTSETGIFKFYASGNRSWFSLNNRDLSDINKMNRLDLTNDNYYLNTSFKEILNEKWTLFTGLAYTYDRDVVNESFKVNTKEQSAQAKITLSNQINDQMSLRFGTEYMHNTFDEHFTSSDGTVFNTDLNEDYTAGFLETDFYFSSKLVARVGGRLEYSDILKSWNIAPRTSLAYKTSSKSQVSLAYGQFYQNPENDLLRFNTAVDFERADHYMLNYQLMKDSRIFRVEGYFKKYQNLVKYDTATPWMSSNQGDGYAKGVDVFFRDRKSIKKGDYWISYSFLDTERDYRDFPIAAAPTFASKHNLSLVYKHWIHKWSTSIGITYSHASGRPFHNPNLEGFNAQRTNSYNDLSFNASKLTNIGGNFTVFFFSISNVPGFKNNFGYRYSTIPNNDGVFEGRAVQPNAKRFFFVGMFMQIGEKFDKENTVKPPE